MSHKKGISAGNTSSNHHFCRRYGDYVSFQGVQVGFKLTFKLTPGKCALNKFFAIQGQDSLQNGLFQGQNGQVICKHSNGQSNSLRGFMGSSSWTKETHETGVEFKRFPWCYDIIPYPCNNKAVVYILKTVVFISQPDVFFPQDFGPFYFTVLCPPFFLFSSDIIDNFPRREVSSFFSGLLLGLFFLYV